MGEIVPFPRERIVREPRITKHALARAIGYSTRWIEIQTASNGLPAYRQRNGERRYLLSEVQAWMEERGIS